MILLLRQKVFGAASKALYAVSPGAWHAKEAAKYMADDELDYRDTRKKYALRGALTPSTARAMHYMAADMHNNGKSSKQIKAAVEEIAKKHGVASRIPMAGVYYDITDKGPKYRKSFKKKDKR